MSKTSTNIIIGLFGILIIVISWRLVVMPYQQGADLKGCITGTTAGGVSIEKMSAIVDACVARAKYPTWK